MVAALLTDRSDGECKRQVFQGEDRWRKGATVQNMQSQEVGRIRHRLDYHHDSTRILQLLRRDERSGKSVTFLPKKGDT